MFNNFISNPSDIFFVFRKLNLFPNYSITLFITTFGVRGEWISVSKRLTKRDSLNFNFRFKVHFFSLIDFFLVIVSLLLYQNTFKEGFKYWTLNTKSIYYWEEFYHLCFVWMEQRNWKLRRASSSSLVELPLRFLHRKSPDRPARTHRGPVMKAGLEPGRVECSVILKGQHYSGLPRPGGPLGMTLPAPGRGRMLPSCNHRWHTQSTFPDQLSCPSSWVWGKQRRKNNTSPGSGNVASTNTAHVKKIKAGRHAALLKAVQPWKWGYVQPHPATMTCQSTQMLFTLTQP